VPPPFNIIPTPKSVWYLIRWIHRRVCGQSRAAKKEHMRTIRVRSLDFLIDFALLKEELFELKFQNLSHSQAYIFPFWILTTHIQEFCMRVDYLLSCCIIKEYLYRFPVHKTKSVVYK